MMLFLLILLLLFHVDSGIIYLEMTEQYKAIAVDESFKHTNSMSVLIMVRYSTKLVREAQIRWNFEHLMVCLSVLEHPPSPPKTSLEDIVRLGMR